MCNKKKIVILFVFIMFLFGCSTSPGSNQEEAPKPKGPYFEGGGGKGLRIAVLEPAGKNLSKEDGWLLTLIQGSITGDFNKYSGMTVIDRQNLDKIRENQRDALSGDFTDDDFISIGKITNARYIVIGSLTKLSSNSYVFGLSVSDAEKGERKASYPPQPCTYEQISGLSVIKDATEDILNQLGVNLTDSGRQALHTVSQSSIRAETALSKGIAAQKDGTVVEALSYYYDAAGFDSTLKEANGRISLLAADISSGNIGENVRNDIQRRKAWLDLLQKSETFFKAHLPYEIIYSTTLIQGNIDYKQETVDLRTSAVLKPTNSIKALDTIAGGLEETGKRREWDWGFWPIESGIFSDLYYPHGINTRTQAKQEVEIDFVLMNDAGKIISTASVSLESRVFFALGKKLKRESWDYGYVFRDDWTGDYYAVDTTKLEVLPGQCGIVFSGVNANDITDTLTIKAVKVNGMDAGAAARNGYIKITPVTGPIP